MSMDLSGMISQSRIVPEPPLNEKQESEVPSRLAHLLCKHRRQLTGKDKASCNRPLGVFEITMAALRASKADKPPQLTSNDVSAFQTSLSITKPGWVFIQVRKDNHNPQRCA